MDLENGKMELDRAKKRWISIPDDSILHSLWGRDEKLVVIFKIICKRHNKKGAMEK